MNFEAEDKIERLIWERFVPGVILVVLAIVALYFLR